MPAVEALEDDRDTSLPVSALSPAEYRSFRGLVSQLRHTSVNNQVQLYSALEFLSSFNRVTRNIAQEIIETVLGAEHEEFVGDGHIYAMIRLVGHWQTDGQIEKSMVFVQAPVPEQSGSKVLNERKPSTPSLPPQSTILNPFRANSTSSSSPPIVRTPAVDRGVEAFKRLIFANNREAPHSDVLPAEAEGSTPRVLAPTHKFDDSASLQSRYTDHSTTGMTFVYTSDEEDEVVSSVKHSPETRLRESPQPVLQLDMKSLPPLQIPQTSPYKPAPPPSRKRGASGSNQNPPTSSEERLKPEEKTPGVKRNLPPTPPAPRRTLSSASTSRAPRPERTSSMRRELPPQPQPLDLSPSSIKPPPPRSRRKLSDTSETSDTTLRTANESEPLTQNISPPSTSSGKRLSTQAPPPPPPPRSRKTLNEMPSSPTSGPSTDLAPRLSFDRPDSPRRSSIADERPNELQLQDSELSLELGRLQREVDELVYGLTKKRGGGAREK